MHSNDTARVTHIETCDACRQPIRPTDCYRRMVNPPGVSHMFCLCVRLTVLKDRAAGLPSRSGDELRASYEDAAPEICAEVCENPKHRRPSHPHNLPASQLPSTSQ